MQCRVIKPFHRRGVVQNLGTIIDIPEEMILTLAEYVQAAAAADSYAAASSPTCLPVFKALLTDGGELRTTGVTDDLSAEIRNLTADNMPLQAKLLRLHCEMYSGVHWHATVRAWRERARHWFESEGYGLHEANYKAAEEMHLLAFSDELRLKEPRP